MSHSAELDHDHPRLTPAVQGLIATNIAVWFLTVAGIVKYADLAGWFAFDGSAFPGRWWTIGTYMFVHNGALHVAANMATLWLFGSRLEEAWGQKRFLWFYVLCGLGGVAFHAIFLRSGDLVGASAAVFGVMTAYAMQWPNDEVHLFGVMPIRVRSLAVGLLVFNLSVGLIGTGATGSVDGANIAYFAHVGGVLAAYAYVRMSASTTMDQVRQRVANLPDADEPPRAIPRTLPRSRDRADDTDDIVAKSKAIAAKRATVIAPGTRRREPRPDEVNRVLDKISQHGIESLTSDERRLLEEMSKKLRDR